MEHSWLHINRTETQTQSKRESGIDGNTVPHSTEGAHVTERGEETNKQKKNNPNDDDNKKNKNLQQRVITHDVHENTKRKHSGLVEGERRDSVVASGVLAR